MTANPGYANQSTIRLVFRVAGETMPVVKDSLAYVTGGQGLPGLGKAGKSGAFCSKCGVRNDEGARFCDACGTALA